MSSQRIHVFGAKPAPSYIKVDLKPQGEPSMTLENELLLKSFMLQTVHCDVSVNEFACHGALTFVFKNPIATPVEMHFAFPLMDGGVAITGITTDWDGQHISGLVCSTDEGKKKYDEAVAKGHTASIVQHAENDLFLWRVGGIPGGSTVTVVSQFSGPVTMAKKFGKKPQTEITLTLPVMVPPWFGKAECGDAALAYDTAVQAPASFGGLDLALPPFTCTVRSHFVTQSLQAVTVTSPTHGPPDASSIRASDSGLVVSFRDLFKARDSGKTATNLQMRWVADGIVPNLACLGRLLAGAGQLAPASSESDSVVLHDDAAIKAMEVAAAALASGPLAIDAQALLQKTKTNQRKIEQVCGVLFSEHDGRHPEGVHVTVLVDCSGSMYPHRIVGARKAVRALLTSLEPTSTFSVYFFGDTCFPVVLGRGPEAQGPVFPATPDLIKAVAAQVDAAADLGGTLLFAAVQQVMSNDVPADRRHNVMILTDGEVGSGESSQVKEMLAQVCPDRALVGIIGIGNAVTRFTLRTIVEGGLGPQAILFDDESDESITSIVLGSINALASSQLREIHWPELRMVGSEKLVQINSSEVCAAWALYPETQLACASEASAADEEWEEVTADMFDAGAAAGASSAPRVRWLDGRSVSIASCKGSSRPAVQLPTLLVTHEDSVKSMCIAAALARCRHSTCSRQEATALALRYGFVCAEADSVMVATSNLPTCTPSSAVLFRVPIPSQAPPATQCFATGKSSGKRCKLSKRFLLSLTGNAGKTTLSSTLHRAAPPPPNHHSASADTMRHMPPKSHPTPKSHPAPQCTPPFTAAMCGNPEWQPNLEHFGDFETLDDVAMCGSPKSEYFGECFSLCETLDDVAFCLPPAQFCPPPPPLATFPIPHSPAFALPGPASIPSLLDVLGALDGAVWSMQHPAVAAFLDKHLPAAVLLCTSDALTTVAVIVAIRATFKDSKAGWHVHIQRAARCARSTLGDAAYAAHKAAVVSTLGTH